MSFSKTVYGIEVKLIVLVCLNGFVVACSSAQKHKNKTDTASLLISERSQPDSALQTDSEVQQKKSVESWQAGTQSSSPEYHYSLAQAYSADGDSERAIEELKLAALYDPKSSLIQSKLAVEYLKRGMPSFALGHCEKAIELDEKDDDARLLLAGIYSSAGEHEKALKEYAWVLKRNPRHEEAMAYQTQTLFELGRKKEASELLRNFVKKNPKSSPAWYYIGRAEQSFENPDKAIQAYGMAMSLREGFTQAALAAGLLYESQGKTKQALDVYKKVYEQTQDLVLANRIANILLKEEKFVEALVYLDVIRLADPEDMNAQVKAGLILVQLKKYDQAVQLFSEILIKNPDSDRVNYYIASVYEEKMELEKSIFHFKKIGIDSRLFGDAVLRTVYDLKKLGKESESIGYVEEALKRSPVQLGLYVFLAGYYEENKKINDAIRTLEVAIEHFPEEEKVRYYLGVLYDRVGKVDLAIKQMESILSQNAESVDAMNYLGYTWTVQGVRLKDAEGMIKKALKLNPTNGFIQDSWGWHLFVTGRLHEAVKELEKAARLKPNEPAILEHLAQVYQKISLREKALSAYERAIQNEQEESACQKIQEKIDALREYFVKEGRIKPNRMPASTLQE